MVSIVCVRRGGKIAGQESDVRLALEPPLRYQIRDQHRGRVGWSPRCSNLGMQEYFSKDGDYVESYALKRFGAGPLSVLLLCGSGGRIDGDWNSNQQLVCGGHRVA